MIAFIAFATQRSQIRIVTKNIMDYLRERQDASFIRCTEGVSQMSRIFAPNRFRFLLGLLSWAMLIAVGLDVQESRAQELIPTSTAPTGFLPKGQPFLSLLDDVTVEDRTGYFSNEAQCQLNAPLTPQAEVIDQAPPEASYDWAALLTYPCGNMACDDMACGNCSTYILSLIHI